MEVRQMRNNPATQAQIGLIRVRARAYDMKTDKAILEWLEFESGLGIAINSLDELQKSEITPILDILSE